MDDKEKLNLYTSYHQFKQSVAGKDFFDFLEGAKKKAIESGMKEDNPEARGEYKFIRRVELKLESVEREVKRIQNQTKE